MRQLAGSFSGSVTRVTGSLAGSMVLGPSDARFSLKFYNNSDAVVYIGYLSASTPAAQVSPSFNFTHRLPSASFYEDEHRYTGPISVVWQTSPTTGSLMITELF